MVRPILLIALSLAAHAAPSEADHRREAVRLYRESPDAATVHFATGPADEIPALQAAAEEIRREVRRMEDEGKAMRGEGKTPSILGTGASPVTGTPARDADRPAEETPAPTKGERDLRRETVILAGVLMALAAIGWGIGWGGVIVAPKMRTSGALIRCPGCRKTLRVPRKGKRIKVRCPACGKVSAYNPGKDPKA